MKEQRKRFHSALIWIITASLLFLTALLIFLFISYSHRIGKQIDDKTYDRYYAMIVEDTSSEFWQSVYRSAKIAGEEQNAYVEMISENLSQDYSVYELMEIAISSGVDGIIVSANESAELSTLIDKAYDRGIPVVTLFSDNANSERLSFVGVSYYNLGREYGNLILEMAQKKTFVKDTIRVAILVDKNPDNFGQNVLFAAIKDTVENENRRQALTHTPIEVSAFLVDSTNTFSVEESIRKMFGNSESILPDIVVGLNEIDTTSIYQSVVDYNAVGSINILGYYDSATILKGIERNVIYATVSIDTEQMGQYCIGALSEYFEYGYTSQYFATDIYVVNKDNVAAYLKEDDHEN